ncbi:MAG: preprotein translocase subunit SecB, partial [Phototrophicales bacterium]
TALNKAIKSLVIQDVYLRNSSSIVAEGFEPKYQDKNTSYLIQFKHLVEKTEVLELQDNEGLPQQLMRVFVQVGCRLLNPNNDDGAEAASRVDDDYLVQIEAQYIAEYMMTEPLEQEAIDAFALENVSYHVWPYWRDYLTSLCLRMNLPKIMLPI